MLKFLNKKYSFNINNNNNNNSNNGSNYKSPNNESPNNESPNNDFDNNDDKLITIKIGKSFEKLYPLNINNLLSKPVVVFYNALLNRNDIIKNYKNVSGIYLLHNSVNGKQYIGSGYNLSTRLSTYYYPSRLLDKRYISNSILKYGHDYFSVVILEIFNKDSIIRTNLIKKEQYYIDLYKPILNINTIAGSILGFRHTDETKKL